MGIVYVRQLAASQRQPRMQPTDPSVLYHPTPPARSRSSTKSEACTPQRLSRYDVGKIKAPVPPLNLVP